MWAVKSALTFLSIISLKNFHQRCVFSVMIVFIVAVTDASTQEDLSEFNAGKNNSFCRLKLPLQAFQHFIQDNPLFTGKKLEWK